MLYAITRIAQEEGKEDQSSITDLFFEKLENAHTLIEQDGQHGPYGLCESHYNYIVVEQIQVQDQADAADELWQEWYKFTDFGDGSFQWLAIPAPAWAGKTVSFFTAS